MFAKHIYLIYHINMRKYNSLKLFTTISLVALSVWACGTETIPIDEGFSASVNTTVSEDSVSEDIVEPTRAAVEGLDPAVFQFDGGHCAELLYNGYDLSVEDSVSIAQSVYSYIKSDVSSLENVVITDEIVTLDCVDSRGEVWSSLSVER